MKKNSSKGSPLTRGKEQHAAGQPQILVCIAKTSQAKPNIIQNATTQIIDSLYFQSVLVNKHQNTIRGRPKNITSQVS